jgi:drug/metabolite transporter (DMT)-like permease
MSAPAPTPQAFFTLVLIACLMGGNHVAARLAFDHGVDVVTAVAARSVVTALAVGVLVRLSGVSLAMTPRQRAAMLLIGALVALQSVWLYSSVARLPVGLALLAFNTYPLWTAFWAWALYRHRPERAVLVAMPLILVGLALALDVAGAASGLGAQAQWGRIGSGVAFALGAAATFGVILALTQHEVAALDGRLRSALTMALVGVLAGGWVLAGDGLHLPNAALGWVGLAALTLLYGTGFTMMFTVLPRMGVVGGSPIMNVEPVAALMLAWPLLGQAIAPVQWAGALIVVGTVIALGWRGRRPVRAAGPR